MLVLAAGLLHGGLANQQHQAPAQEVGEGHGGHGGRGGVGREHGEERTINEFVEHGEVEEHGEHGGTGEEHVGEHEVSLQHHNVTNRRHTTTNQLDSELFKVKVRNIVKESYQTPCYFLSSLFTKQPRDNRV